MAVASLQYISPEEYLAIERVAETKSEYHAGVMYAMSGASREHVLISGSAASELRTQLKGKPCETYATDMRVNVSRSGLYTYPDVVVVCGDPEFIDSNVDTLRNPTVIIEVLSPSTAPATPPLESGEGLGEGAAKFEFYRGLESLQEYVMVWQDRPHVEHCTKQPDGTWVLAEANGLESEIVLTSIDCRLALADLYERIQFQETAEPLRPPTPE